ncbi:predicted protein [Verticillium alfalfae VaMs.102]|uniref:Predicted protein n=1 Tax=Verticillium alfalfae (strain VaMs.102 / ATCC MYA-4576 / FGSC 10136) TaxID=526221 RepID=C9SQB8_VERA1|nr:predicted protein [Verticillium alfalfae VaMs.102]EEY21043.1 predicted protein [Verticillium alfalfae VaMs.102]
MNYPPQDQPGSAKSRLLRPTQTTGRQKPRPSQQPSQPVPFDPEDLSRRLSIVLAQQKAHAERRRTPKTDSARHPKPALSHPAASSSHPQDAFSAGAVAKKSSQPPTAAKAIDSTSPPLQDENGSYIPRVAATQFARTTTAADMAHQDLAHMFSRRAINTTATTTRSHRSGADPGVAMPPIPRQHPLTVAAPSTMTSADLDPEPPGAHEHSQTLQRNRILEAATAAGEAGDLQGRYPQRHTIEGPIAMAAVGGAQATEEQLHGDDAARRVSTGDLLGRPHANGKGAAAADDEPEVPPHDVNEHRVDWTQSDERPKTRSTPLLRKADSIWTLRGSAREPEQDRARRQGGRRRVWGSRSSRRRGWVLRALQGQPLRVRDEHND